MIHDIGQIAITLYPNRSLAWVSKRTGFNAGINSHESDCRWLPWQLRQMKLFVPGNLYK